MDDEPIDDPPAYLLYRYVAGWGSWTWLATTPPTFAAVDDARAAAVVHEGGANYGDSAVYMVVEDGGGEVARFRVGPGGEVEAMETRGGERP